MRGGVLIPAVLIILMGVCVAAASQYPYLQAKLVPLMVCGVIAILSVVQLVGELRARGRTSVPRRIALYDADDDEANREISFRAYLTEGAWMVGFLLLVYAIGFLAGIGVFTAAYAGLHKSRWSIAVALGGCMAALSYLLFAYLVDGELYPGILLRLAGLAD